MGIFDRFKTPKWKHEDRKVRLEAVKKLNDQGILVEIAKNDSDSDVREEAIKKINDESVLAYIAKHDSSWSVREEAVKKINDESVLADVAKNASNDIVRREAVKKISDESVLADVAKNDSNDRVRLYAAKKINDENLINKIENKIEEEIKEREEEIKERRKKKIQVLNDSVDELLRIYESKPSGFLTDSPSAEPVRRIGEKLNDAGGFDMMLQAHKMFSMQNRNGRNLEMVWDGIGRWQG